MAPTKGDIAISGNVDHLSNNNIRGWACIKNRPERKLEIRIESGNRCIATGMADLKRDDLVIAGIGGGHCAFSIQIADAGELDKIVVIAKDAESGVEMVLPRRSVTASADKRPAYQSFEGQKGDSNSEEKLRALRLPASFEGYNVLDIGCNEGFFCIESLRRGAAKVIGIDSNKDVIDRARKRTDKVEYRVGSWWDIPNDTFDIIFFLSAIHYEKNQKELLHLLSKRLTPRGKLILECGMSLDRGKSWKVVRRHDGFMRFPTEQLLKEVLLADYAVTGMGPSVPQAGDPVGRHVFHCSRLRSTYLLVRGKSGTGKSNFAYQAAGPHGSHGAFYSIDWFFHEIKSLKLSDVRGDSLLTMIHDKCDLNNIDAFTKSVIAEGMADALALKILERAPTEVNFLVIEGQALEHAEVEQAIVRELERRGGIVWRAERIMTEG